MFDFHMHSKVSFDSEAEPERMVQAALNAGLKEICFTDHVDHPAPGEPATMIFDLADYHRAYDHLTAEGMKIRRGCEIGLKQDNAELVRRDSQRRQFDFVIGSIHFVDNLDIYEEPYWRGRTVEHAYQQFLETTLQCVRIHEDYDVLGHLTYISKTMANPTHERIPYETRREIMDEILKELVKKGKGLEINSSGVDRCGAFLPDEAYFRRFRELGGEIVTFGSDAHSPERVGQYAGRAMEILKDTFGYVCTFEDRKPIFHKL